MEMILEQQRYHEEWKRLLDVMVKEMLTKKSMLHDKINSDHCTQAMEMSGTVEFEELLKARDNPSEEAQNRVEFTDEEGYGRYLDLHGCYLKYANLKSSEKLDYITCLSTFDQLFDIPKERKNAEYKRYLEMLLAYLQDYTDRVKPLLDQN
ncbi:hypothetical protein DUI87_24749 [Hirundo rustica rustica]|uniref:SF3A3 domain-containing protein n=1 Tax=Hirundo rustica rustica TaxID=333673 RepID=A0A3M0JC46_HIRRU|nr:hypothetical protein DUI87_24749 [Hirundo rustica rustica]